MGPTSRSRSEPSIHAGQAWSRAASACTGWSVSSGRSPSRSRRAAVHGSTTRKRARGAIIGSSSPARAYTGGSWAKYVHSAGPPRYAAVGSSVSWTSGRSSAEVLNERGSASRRALQLGPRHPPERRAEAVALPVRPEARTLGTGRVEEGQRGVAGLDLLGETSSGQDAAALVEQRGDGLLLLEGEADDGRGEPGHRRGPRVEENQPLVGEELGEHAGERRSRRSSRHVVAPEERTDLGAVGQRGEGPGHRRQVDLHLRREPALREQRSVPRRSTGARDGRGSRRPGRTRRSAPPPSSRGPRSAARRAECTAASCVRRASVPAPPRWPPCAACTGDPGTRRPVAR